MLSKEPLLKKTHRVFCEASISFESASKSSAFELNAFIFLGLYSARAFVSILRDGSILFAFTAPTYAASASDSDAANWFWNIFVFAVLLRGSKQATSL